MRVYLTLAAVVLVSSLLLAACQTAPTPTPTVAPTATPAPQLSAPTPTKPAAAASPTAAAPAAPVAAASPTAPAATPTAAAKSKGKVTLVSSGELATMDAILRSYLVETWSVYPSIVEQLTARNPKTFAVEGSLATKWEQTKPDTWRYTLRKDVKFHNGEPFNADAIVYSFTRAADKDLASGGQKYWPAGGKVAKVDDFTVDVISSTADPIQPLRLIFIPVVAPKWAKENPEEMPIKLIGTGPYKFVEWNKGQFLKMTAVEDHWAGAPKIKDATVMWRAEAQVRAAMVKTGEADWAYSITPELVKDMPKTAAIASSEVMAVRLDQENPVLKDKRVRLALNLAIDKDSIVSKLFSGFADPARGQIDSDYVIGFNPDLKPYPYDLEQAKKLVAEAKAAGVPTDTTELDVLAAKGRFPHLEEMTESLADTWGKIGLKIKVVVTEQAKWQDMWAANKPGQKRVAMAVWGSGNELGDASKTYDQMVNCKGLRATYCNTKLDEQAAKAFVAVGDERAKIYRDVAKQVYDDAVFVPLFRLKPIYGLSKRLNWQPRIDDLVAVQEMSLTE